MPAVASDVVSGVADTLFDAIERGDYSAIEKLWACHVSVWRSGSDGDDDRVRALKVIRWFIRTTTSRSYEILDRRCFDGGFVQQHVLHADGTNGSSIALRVCIVVEVEADGLISRIDEYFDPADIAPLLRRTT